MRRPAIALIAVTTIAATGLALVSGSVGADGAAMQAVVTKLAGGVGVALEHLLRIPPVVAHGYLRTPEMIIGLGTALALPLVALLSVTARWIARRRADRQRMTLTGRRCEALGPRTRPSAKAWLEVSGTSGVNGLEVGSELTRIGHDADNDLALPFTGVQQFHAVIRRTPESEFMLVDITGQAGFGIAVNGRRLRSCALRDGDRIELGPTAVTFHRARIAERAPDNVTQTKDHRSKQQHKWREHERGLRSYRRAGS